MEKKYLVYTYLWHLTQMKQPTRQSSIVRTGPKETELISMLNSLELNVSLCKYQKTNKLVSCLAKTAFNAICPGLKFKNANSIDILQYMTWPRGYKTWVHSQTQNKVHRLVACGHMSASSQSLFFILSLRMDKFHDHVSSTRKNVW